MKFKGLTIDQINYLLKKGLASREDAEEAVKWWNDSRVATVAHMVSIGHPDSAHPYSFPQIVISDI